MISVMRAVSLRGGFGVDHLVLEDRAVPSCGAGQILIRLRAASLNYRDLLMIEGKYDPKLKLPLVPCSDGAGDVIEVAPDVTRFRVGDRVCPTFARGWLDGPPTRETPRRGLGGPLDGTLAEYFVADAESAVKFPDHLSYVEAATLPCAAVTAFRALFEESSLAPGQSLLVLGTGGVSTFALALGKLAGARVFVTSRDPGKLARALSLGADEGIDLSQTPEFGREVRRRTEDRGVDHVLEVGGAGTLGESLRAVSAGGTISLVGVVASGATPSLVPAVMRNVRLQGILVGSRATFEALNRAASEHRLRPVIDRTFDLGSVREAFEHLASGKHVGKICLEL
jgi:NADPH:quinone reductase-like Zn-dependent oxidoreductase